MSTTVPVPDMAGAIERGLGFLTGARNADGSWGYQPNLPGHAEPTLLAAAAGLPLATAWLATQERSWPFLLLPAVAAETDKALAHDVGAWIVGRQSVSSTASQDFDSTIVAWSWVEGTSAWVEPTAYALLSLRRIGMGSERAAEGQRLLRDRMCTGGGWNYGNPRMLGTELEPQSAPTGWALLTFDRGDPVADTSLPVLARTLEAPSTLALSLAALAHVHHGRDASAFVDPLVARIGDQGARGRIDLTALAVLALSSVASNHVVFTDPS
jgi:hypothetical protein